MKKRNQAAFIGLLLFNIGALLVLKNVSQPLGYIGLILLTIALLILLPLSAFGRAIKRFVNAEVFKIRCPDCGGTGICHHPRPIHSHSCCGDCKRISVPVEKVPNDFDGGRYKDGTVIIGSGVLYVDFVEYVRQIWLRGRRAFPPKKIVNPHLDPARTKQSAAMRTH